MPGKHRFCRFLYRTDAPTTKLELRTVVGIALLILVTQSASSQAHESTVPSAIGLSPSFRLEPPAQNVRAFPRVSLGGGRELQYLGTFCANAKYKKSSKFSRTLESLTSTSQFTSVLGGDVAVQSVAPGWMLVPSRRVVEDFEAPAYATRIAELTSNLTSIRDRVVTFAYGPARVMAAPHQVTTDSMLRVIISDPDLLAVHVFDPKGKRSFSILGGQHHRLRQPAGVAVDAEDNIYTLIPSGESCWSITSMGNSYAISGCSMARPCMNVQPELQSTGRQAVYISPIRHAISCLSSICKVTFWSV